MKKFLQSVLFTCFAMFLASNAPAAERGTQEEAAAMVTRAVAYLKANGQEKALAEFSNPKGQFVDRDLYIFVIDQQGNMLAHGNLPKIIGKKVLEMKDADDQYLFKNMLAATATKNTAWINYKWNNPITNTIGAKATYLERVGNLVIGCGVYK